MLDINICNRIMENISQVIVGKQGSIELLLVALLGEGHILLEDVPGLGKTLLAKAIAGVKTMLNAEAASVLLYDKVSDVLVMVRVPIWGP